MPDTEMSSGLSVTPPTVTSVCENKEEEVSKSPDSWNHRVVIPRSDTGISAVYKKAQLIGLSSTPCVSHGTA